MAEPIVLPSPAHPGLVLAPGPQGRCDDRRVGGAVVDHDPASGLWRMWYYCRDEAYDRPAPPTLGSGRIALATSVDGIAWARVDGGGEHGAVMSPDAGASRFDSGHIGLTDVTREAEGWRMWYFGGNGEILRTGTALGDVPGLAMRCGSAASADGIHWTRLPGATPSGALFEILDDEFYAAWPNAIPLPGGTLLQYTAPSHDMGAYHTRVVKLDADGGIERLGALTWGDGACEHDVGGIITRHVVPDPRAGREGWLMAYTALAADHSRSIGLAESADGLLWRHVPGGPILRPGAAGCWDDCGVAANRLVVANDRIYLYYYGFRSLTAPDSPRGIGLATASLTEPLRFHRAIDGKILT